MVEQGNTEGVVMDIGEIRWDKRAELIEKGEPTGCLILDAFLKVPLPKLCEEVAVIRNEPARKMYVEAALLTEAAYSNIGDVLDIHAEIIELYALVYFDVQEMDRISKVAVIESCQDSNERNLKLWSVMQGLDFVAWRLGKKVSISPTEALSSLMSDSYFKAKESFFNDSTSASSQQALRWTKQTQELAKLLKGWVSDADEAVKDIEFALREFTEDDMQFDMLDTLNLDEEPYDGEFDEIPNEADDKVNE